MSEFANLINKVHSCSLCAHALPYPPQPIFSLDNKSKILIIGQAPGLKAHKRKVPFDDNSGVRLREWLGISSRQFYDPKHVSILPLGLCFPGYANKGDAPPRKECAPMWHEKLLPHLSPILTLYVGRYAQKYYLPQYATLTDAIKSDDNAHMVLPHPSGRNNRWLAKNKWFEDDTLPLLRQRVKNLLNG